MNEELLTLIEEFLSDIDTHNHKKPPFEDDTEPTFYNFYKWLLVKVTNK